MAFYDQCGSALLFLQFPPLSWHGVHSSYRRAFALFHSIGRCVLTDIEMKLVL
jgi:hypothetical protein